MRRFAKMLSGQVGRGSFVVLSRVLQLGRNAWRSFAQMGEGSTEFPLPCARVHLTQEVWAFAHPSDQTGRFWSLSSRISVVSTSVSTAGATGCFCAAFFDGLGLGFALATVRCAALDTLRALPRLAAFPLGSFPRFCTFDCFLRFAMIAPFWLVHAGSKHNAACCQTTPAN
jgi:hypothetical protein